MNATAPRWAPGGSSVSLGILGCILVWSMALVFRDPMVATLASDLGGIACCTWALRRRAARLPVTDTLARRPMGVLEMSAWALGAVACWYGGQLCWGWLSRHDPPSTSSITSSQAVVLMVAAVVVAPVFEELLCRGLLLRWTTARWGPVAGVIASTTVFALIHADGHRMVHTAALGLFLSLLALRTRRLVVTIVVHAGYNLVTLLVPVGPINHALAVGLVLALAPGASMAVWMSHRPKRVTAS